MKSLTFLCLTLIGKEGITGQLLLSAQQASEDVSEAPSAKLCSMPRLTPSRVQTLMALFCQVLQAQLPTPNSLSQLAQLP